MDEAAFRAVRGAAGARACVFEKALLAQCAGCAHAARHALAEREAIGCRTAVAHANCATLLGMLRERSAFALRLGPAGGPLPHAAAMRLQCGGLSGLAQALDADAGVAADVHGLVVAAQARYGSLSDLPWPGLVAAVTGWHGRRRRGDSR
jgi:hypothetical protein